MREEPMIVVRAFRDVWLDAGKSARAGKHQPSRRAMPGACLMLFA